MADYPGAFYAPRTKSNKPGVVYNAAKESVGYAEDVIFLDDEVVAIETELGFEPKGSSADVAEKIAGLRSLDDSEDDVLIISGKMVGIGTPPDHPLHIDWDVDEGGYHEINFVEIDFSVSLSEAEADCFNAEMNDTSFNPSVGHTKRGFVVNNQIKHNLIGGDWVDKGCDYDMGGLSEIPGIDTGANYLMIGSDIRRHSICLSDLLGGSWDDLVAGGIRLRGWHNDEDDVSGFAGSVDRFALDCDGGLVRWNSDHHDSNYYIGKFMAGWAYQYIADDDEHTFGGDVIIEDFGLVGFVRNDANGLLSGGNMIDSRDVVDLGVVCLLLNGENDHLLEELELDCDFIVNAPYTATFNWHADFHFGARVIGNGSLQWRDDLPGDLIGQIMAHDVEGFRHISNALPFHFFNGYAPWKERFTIEAFGNIIFNSDFQDDDYTINKETAGSIFHYDSDLDLLLLGDTSGADYSQFDGVGQLTFYGDARVTKAIDMAGASYSRGGSPPTGITVGNYLVWKYGVNDDSCITFELPHDWAVGTDVQIEVDWSSDVADATKNVKWQVSWTATPHDDTESLAVAGTTIDDGDDACPAVANYLKRKVVGVIAGASLAMEDEIGLCVKRIIADGTAPGVGTDNYITHLYVNYISDKLGEAL